jgi:membrane-associated phospholipid phosphatase
MDFIKRNSIFISLCLALFIALGIALALIPKAELHLWMNGYHTVALDNLFRYYTKIAEWFPYVIALALLFYKAGWAAFFAADTALSSLVGQIVKHIVNAPRPLTYFAQHFPDIQLQLVDGVRMNRFFSFPSGHTISFFAMCFALSLIVADYFYNSNKPYANGLSACCQVIFFIIAVLGAYSRIYLSQHFAADICGGAAISFSISIILCLILPLLSSKKWWNWHFFAKKQ